MNEFTLPTNIKQIGSIGEGLRIYVEDYVCTYLFQYAEAGGYNERIALLVGRTMVIDGQSVLFINGAIQGKYVEEKNGLLSFTEKTGEYADTMIAEHFQGMEIVGWMQSQPSYGTYLNQQYANYHMREFTREYQVMFVMDPLERINAFYTCNADRSGLKEARGYFVYYDKNKNMHEYMLKNKVTDSDYKTQIPAYIELTKMEHVGEAPKSEQPEETIRRRQSERTHKKTAVEQRRTLNLLVSLSAVLFVVCFVMGAGLIQNQDRITQMEDQLIQLSTAYRNLFVQINAEGTASVFAAQSDEDNTTSETGMPNVEPSAPVQAAPNAQTAPVAPNEQAAPVAPASDTAQSPPAGASGGVTVDPQTGTGGTRVIEENGLSTSTAEPTPMPTPAPTPAPTPVPATENTEAAATAETSAASTGQSSVPEAYTIQPGDSLIAISIRFYGDSSMVSEILAVNGLDDADKIIAGKTIALPRR